MHRADIQESIMRDVLRMSDERIAEFGAAAQRAAVRAAACGLRIWRSIRLCGDLLTGTNSIRDVIAFPKSMKGEDLFARSPGQLTEGADGDVSPAAEGMSGVMRWCPVMYYIVYH